MAVDRHAGHRIPLHPPLKRAAAYPTTTGIRHLAQVLTEPPERTSICPALPRPALHPRWRPPAGAIRIGAPWRRAPTGIRSLERGRFGPCWKPRNILPAA